MHQALETFVSLTCGAHLLVRQKAYVPCVCKSCLYIKLKGCLRISITIILVYIIVIHKSVKIFAKTIQESH